MRMAKEEKNRILLYKFDYYSNRSIAEKLGCSHQSIAKYLNRIRAVSGEYDESCCLLRTEDAKQLFELVSACKTPNDDTLLEISEQTGFCIDQIKNTLAFCTRIKRAPHSRYPVLDRELKKRGETIADFSRKWLGVQPTKIYSILERENLWKSEPAAIKMAEILNIPANILFEKEQK